MLTVELLLRGATLGVIALTAIAIAPRAREAGPLSLVLLALGMSAYVLVASPAALRPGDALHWPLVLVAMGNPALIWWAGLEVFDDSRLWRRWVGPLVAVLVGLALIGLVYPLAGLLRGAVSAALYLHLIAMVIAGRGGDLVPARRQFRAGFVVLAAATGIAVTWIEVTVDPKLLGPALFTTQALVVLAFAATFAVFVLPALPSLFPAPATAGAALPKQSPRDRRVIGKIEQAMAQGAWRTEGLSIGALSGLTGVPEHQLRAAINGAMGHRNFAGFINGYRIRAAEIALRDPEQAGRTILEIAHESGFASLGPFNRAFRAATGMAPAAYRAENAGRI